MDKRVERDSPDKNIRQVTKIMHDLNIGSIPALNAEKLVGIVLEAADAIH